MRVRFGGQPSFVFQPSDWRQKKDAATEPAWSLNRDYVYGYNGSCRSSLHFISETEIAYPLANLVILLDVKSNEQRFFDGHTNDVLCLAWNENQRLCISGQMDVKGADGPKACIWSPDDVSSFCNLLHPGHSRSVSAVALSSDGQTAVTFTTDEASSYYIWRLDFSRAVKNGTSNVGTWLSSGSSGRQPVYAAYLLEPDPAPGKMAFSTVGQNHFRSWTIEFPKKTGASPVVKKNRGTYGKIVAARNPVDWAWRADGAAWMVGDNGHIYSVLGQSVTDSKLIASQHSGATLGCVAKLPDGRWIAGALDGTIFIGDGIRREVKAESRAVFTEAHGRGSLAVFGTANHALVLVDYTRRELVRVLQVSHATEAWAMDFHPELAILATGDTQGHVRFWNVAERKPAVGKVLKMEWSVWSLAFLPTDGSLMALGHDKGMVEVLRFPSLQPAFRERLSEPAERISALRFSDCGIWLAAGCCDEKVYLLKLVTSGDGHVEILLHRVLSGNSSNITAVMFSADSQHVMSNSKDAQILYWNTKDGAPQRHTSMFRDTRWQKPWTAVLGWPVIGLWGDPSCDGSDINSACQSNEPLDELLAFGDDFGCVKLIRFPSPFANPGVKAGCAQTTVAVCVHLFSFRG
ncbi:EMAP [Symbiodinium sp. CCMP2592]|nr:EMAP [Symbiodinium sp. CCMP2592]